MRRTILIVGGGPAGLALARSLAGSPHRVVVIETQPLEALAAPQPDGREIALTLRSQRILSDMGVWQRLPRDEVHPLREAQVRNGASPFVMAMGCGRIEALGHLVSNHHIREALFDAVSTQPNVELICGKRVTHAQSSERGARAELDDGQVLTGDLLVAADSRFSALREHLGIKAAIKPLGHTMLVGRIRHSLPHRGISTEWFDHGRTIALLPLSEGMSGLVVTLPEVEAKRACALPDDQLESLYAGYLGGQWGNVELATRPHAYPLVMTYAQRFSGPRCALIGDTAVGMHPVTAHGFNFGLLGATRLARLIGRAPDPGARTLLTRYAVRHRLATLPLYQATKHLVGLYTDERSFARPIRSGVLRLGALPPVRRLLGRMLSDETRLAGPA